MCVICTAQLKHNAIRLGREFYFLFKNIVFLFFLRNLPFLRRTVNLICVAKVGPILPVKFHLGPWTHERTGFVSIAYLSLPLAKNISHFGVVQESHVFENIYFKTHAVEKTWKSKCKRVFYDNYSPITFSMPHLISRVQPNCHNSRPQFRGKTSSDGKTIETLPLFITASPPPQSKIIPIYVVGEVEGEVEGGSE